MDLKEFIKNKDVEFTKNVIGEDKITAIENELGVTFGKELVKYIIEYGYLAYGHIELYGINSVQLDASDMITQTKYLHQYFTETRAFIALENCGDGKYVIVSSEDRVFEYYSEESRLGDVGMKLFDYIFERFQEVDNI